MSEEIDEQRRFFIAAGTAFLGAAAVPPVETAIQIAKEYMIPKQYNVGEAFKIVFDGILPDLSVGSGNLQAIAQGKAANPSIYIQHAAQRLSCGFRELFKNRTLLVCDDPAQKSFSDIADGLFLGGPLANIDLANYLRYDLVEKTDRSGSKKVFLPRASSQFKLPYESFHGEGTLGEFEGKVRTALRYDGGKVVERPVFALRDHRTGDVFHCDKKGDFLANEFFQIVKTRDSFGRLKVFMWGFHGHSLQGFTSDEEDSFKINMNELVARTEGMNEYQVVLPMAYEHRNALDGPYIHAKADWDKCLVEPI